MLTLSPYVADYMRSRHRLGVYGPKSMRVVTPRLNNLAHHYGNRPLAHLNHAAIERWLGSLDHLAVNSRATYLVSVRQFCAWLAIEGHVAVDPCLRIPAVRRVQPLPRSQPAAAVGLALSACNSHRERAIIWLMVGCGLRRMEVANLRWEHYDELAQVLEVRGSKNGKDRALPVPSSVAAALRPLRGGGSTGPIIRSVRDPHLGVTAETVGCLASAILRRAGVKRAAYDGVSGHALRHTAATDVLDRCKDLRVVQAMLGHEHLATTAIYLRRASVSQLREGMEGRTYPARGEDAA